MNFFDDRDLCSLSRVCTRTRLIANEESVWERKLTLLIQEDPAYQAISHESAAVLRAWFRSPSYKLIYKLLVSLGVWPEGIWREQPSHQHKQRCRGRMYKVSCIPGGRFRGEVFSRQRHAPAFHLQLTEINEHWPGLAIAVPDAEPPFYEFWQTLNAPLVEEAPGARWTAQGPQSCVAFAPSWVSTWCPYKPGRDDAQLLQRQGRGAHVPMLFCCHMMPLPLPDALPPLDRAGGQPPSTDAILGRLQGVYSTFYGPHGMEALHITYGMMDPPLSTLLPHGKCFAGLKITGDPNVPAGKVSFCVSAENARMGTYNGFEREEVEPGVIDDVFRDIVSFGPGDQFQLVDIAARPVIARYYGLGQINASTQLWAPKWVEVQVIAYSGTQPIFSLLWADPGRHWRHIMDFKAMQLSQRPPLSEMP
ncbi:g9936 [Coccomyxa viridis]|uniref:G9936 protein n=1 Tax=Coccomyxa viridis TaxID=1274662 RepID=A0ABP1G432_9CHLO